MKTSELQGAALNWAVRKCVREDIRIFGGVPPGAELYSTDWSKGGPIIEREKIGLSYDYENDEWEAYKWINPDKHMPLMNSGPTPLIAAMRCYVASKLGGDEVEVPEELQGERA